MFAQSGRDILDSWLVTKVNKYNPFDLIKKSVKMTGYTDF